MISNDILLYLQIRASPSQPQRGFIHYLMETDSEAHSKMLGRAQGTP